MRVAEPIPENFWEGDVTRSMGNVQCISWMYPIHISCAYVVLVAGVGCFVTRFYGKALHRWFGVLFLLAMFWTMGASLLIYTTGLPGPIMFFFFIMLVSMSIGLPAIKWHQAQMAARRAEAVDQLVREGKAGVDGVSVAAAAGARVEREMERRTFLERLLSAKALHGLFMTIAWYQIAGRAMVTNPFTSWEGCITYPAMKALDGAGNLVLAPVEGGFDDPVGFAVLVEVPSVLVFVAIAVGGSFLGAWLARRKAANEGETIQLTPA
eukprot:TRINITY_DN4394_c0_g1_i1.p1 TRINITY_DN4394_c0_g1~~TRINITY_DN4394_c0_g1_i1.p1  ORF type:complete len:266 (+),score=90.51 TRINITY_DN4394_c0_g1_i1:125-922(+)